MGVCGGKTSLPSSDYAKLREDFSGCAKDRIEESKEAHEQARALVITTLKNSQNNINLASSNLFTNALNPDQGCPPILGLAIDTQVQELVGIQKSAAVNLRTSVNDDNLRFLRIIRDEMIAYANEQIDEREQKMDRGEQLDEKDNLVNRRASNPLVLNEVPEKCAICFDEFPIQGLVMLRGCKHSFCQDCLRGYVKAKESEGVLIICCPLNECKVAISQRELIAVVGLEKFRALDKRALERVILDDKTMHMCATPDCAYIVCWQGGSDGMPWMLCPKCGHERCLKCGTEPYHQGKDCKEILELKKKQKEEQEEKMNRDLIKQLNYIICPRCSVPIEKLPGCNKMLCFCGCKFCSECFMIMPTCAHVMPNHGYHHPKTGRFVAQSQATPDLHG